MGTAVNVLTVLAGSAIGLAAGARLPERFSRLVMQAVGAFTMLIGIQMAREADGAPALLIVLFGLITGALAGEFLDLAGRLDRLGHGLQQRLAPAKQKFTEGFVTASLLFCVGPMTVIGSIQEGLQGDATILLTKAAMDGITSTALAAALGPGTAFSALTVLVYQGTLTLAAGLARDLLTGAVIESITAAGGLMMMCLALNLWGAAEIRVANLLPGLITAPLLAAVFNI